MKTKIAFAKEQDKIARIEKVLELREQFYEKITPILENIAMLASSGTSSSIDKYKRSEIVSDIQEYIFQLEFLSQDNEFLNGVYEILDIGMKSNKLHEINIPKVLLPLKYDSNSTELEYCQSLYLSVFLRDAMFSRSNTLSESIFLDHILSIKFSYHKDLDITEDIKSICSRMKEIALMSLNPFLEDLARKKILQYEFSLHQEILEYCAELFEDIDVVELMGHNLNDIESSIKAINALSGYEIIKNKQDNIIEYMYGLLMHVIAFISEAESHIKKAEESFIQATSKVLQEESAIHKFDAESHMNEFFRIVKYSSVNFIKLFDGRFNGKFYYNSNLDYVELQLPNLEKYESESHKAIESLETIKAELSKTQQEIGRCMHYIEEKTKMIIAEDGRPELLISKFAALEISPILQESHLQQSECDQDQTPLIGITIATQ
jgi:hypothetical protein